MMEDLFHRRITYIRLSVTDRCNFRCVYCMSEKMQFLPKQAVLSLEELYEVASTFVSLGVTKIRITGGEPLVRNGLVDWIKQVRQIEGLETLALTTNGALLTDYAVALKAAGLNSLNVSVDSLDAVRLRVQVLYYLF
jgi:GTP 3',8-cyclase